MIQFYKPNPKVSGTACSFWVTQNGDAMVSMIKQTSWDDSRKTGSFSQNKGNPKKNVIAKLNETELSGIIDSIESNREFSAFHKSQNQTLQIRFSPYLEKEEQTVELGYFSGEATVKNEKASLSGNVSGIITKKVRPQKGFSLSINKQGKEDSTDKSSFLIGFTFPEGRLLKEGLLNMLFDMKTSHNQESQDQEEGRGGKDSVPQNKGEDSRNSSGDNDSDGW